MFNTIELTHQNGNIESCFCKSHDTPWSKTCTFRELLDTSISDWVHHRMGMVEETGENVEEFLDQVVTVKSAWIDES